jgi:hypothetical protein
MIGRGVFVKINDCCSSSDLTLSSSSGILSKISTLE